MKEYYFGLRNKEVIRVFRDLRLVEQLGSGVPRILKYYGKECFTFSDNFLRITFPNFLAPSSKEKVSKLVDGLVEKLVEGLVESQKKMVYLIDEKPTITIKELAETIGVSTTAIDKNITKLKDKRIIRRVGGDKGGSWEIIGK